MGSNVAFKFGDRETTQDQWADSVTEYNLDETTAEDHVKVNGFRIIDIQINSNADRAFKNILCRSKPSTAAD